MLKLPKSALLLLACIGLAVESANAKVYIIGGTDVPQGERPYQVQLSAQDAEGGRWACGGAIISPDWVLTAAHCVEGRTITHINAGAVSLTSSALVKLVPDGTFIHQDYVFKENADGFVESVVGDIALVRLKSPTRIPQLRLTDAAISAEHAGPGHTVTASGWGWTAATDPQSQPSVLQEVDLTIYDNSCGIEGDQICTYDSTGSSDACRGDSGGPLTVSVAGRDYSVGVASTSNCRGYSTFTKTQSYLSWISETQRPKQTAPRSVTSGWGIDAKCSAPFNHVVTGFGGRMANNNRITTLHLQVRPINEDGSLGDRTIVKCGTVPNHGLEKFVQVPDGYVMTGFGGHVRKNNFIGLTAYASLYDPNSISIVGSTKVYYSGTNGLEMKYQPTAATNANNTVISGIGLRSYKSNIRGYEAQLKNLVNP